MEGLIVGEGELEMNKLRKEVMQSKSFATLIKRWKHFGQYLGVNDVCLLDLEKKYKRGDLELSDMPIEIMKRWKAEDGTNATLKVLYNAMIHCDVRDIAESLLRCRSQETIKSVRFIRHGNVVTLNELLGEDISMETLERIHEKLKYCFDTKPLQLLKKELSPPDLPTYYIPRTFSYPSAEIDQKIFVREFSKDHVFLLKGINKPDLAKVTGYQAIDASGNQLYSVNVNFILLECDEDFHKICKISSMPVHVIERKGKSYFWLKSSGGHDTIRKYLKGEGETLDEKDMATKILSLAPPCAMSIADSPGMGKTLVLANLATKIQQQNLPN